MIKYLKISLLLCLVYLSVMESKFVQRELAFYDIVNVHGHFEYITKYATQKGMGQFKYRFAIKKPLTDVAPFKFKVYALMDSNWEKQQDVYECNEKQALSFWNDSIEVPTNGNWSEWKDGHLGEYAGDHYWFFALSDCEEYQVKNNYDEENYIKVEFIILNKHGNHFSEEKQGLLPGFFILGIIAVIFCLLLLRNVIKFLKTKESLDYPLLLIYSGFITFTLALVSILTYKYLFSVSGAASEYLVIGYHVLSHVSTIIMTITLIMLAYGWTYTIKTAEDTFDKILSVLPIIIFICIFEIIVMFLQKSTEEDDDHFRYHDYEGLFGGIIYVMKIFDLLVFMFGVWRSFVNSKHFVRVFLTKLGFLGFLYFFIIPFIGIISEYLLPPFLRNRVITIVISSVHLLCLIILTKIFSSKGDYYAIVYQTSTELPYDKLQ